MTKNKKRKFSTLESPSQEWTPLRRRRTDGRGRHNIFSESQKSDEPCARELILVSWNLDAFSPRIKSRAQLIQDLVLEGPKLPDVVFFQEVTRGVRASLLASEKIRAAFIVSDDKDDTPFKGVPFATMTLLSKTCFRPENDVEREDEKAERKQRFEVGRISRMTLPSEYDRDALCVEIRPLSAPDRLLRLVNVHLDSLKHTQKNRAEQIGILADFLRGCSGGIIAGDFNAISPRDHRLVGSNGLIDAWTALHGRSDLAGATWGVDANRRDGLKAGRLDKVAMLGCEAQEIEVLHPGFIEISKAGKASRKIPWSDHCGLRVVLEM